LSISASLKKASKKLMEGYYYGGYGVNRFTYLV